MIQLVPSLLATYLEWYASFVGSYLFCFHWLMFVLFLPNELVDMYCFSLCLRFLVLTILVTFPYQFSWESETNRNEYHVILF